MGTVTKKELIDRISANANMRRAEVRRTVQLFLDALVEELAKGNRLEFRDFGVFEVRERRGRTAQNPKTLERVAVPPKRTVKFKAGRMLRDAVTVDEPPVVHVNSRVPAGAERTR
ncbi:MAG: HU family DNA-binding protein [Phycisphaeraceae bacterium]|nr:HU family DNA-binding protein [Phycisphaeraceae bacterium]MCW5755039.1 HU family DNA-binding protein [Phycisphaeraceae bacterium]